MTREVEMGIPKLLLGGVAALALSVVAGAAEALTITFDTLPTSPLGPQVPNGYADLNWDNFRVLDAVDYPTDPSGYRNSAVSDPNVAVNAFGDPASFTSPLKFALEDLFLTSAWNHALNVEITGLSGGQVVDTAQEVIDTSGPTHVVLNWAGLDQVRFVSSGGVNAGFGGSGPIFAMDNVTVDVVPEPAAWAMLLLGLFGAGALLRRRRAQGVAIS